MTSEIDGLLDKCADAERNEAVARDEAKRSSDLLASEQAKIVMKDSEIRQLNVKISSLVRDSVTNPAPILLDGDGIAHNMAVLRNRVCTVVEVVIAEHGDEG